MKIADQSKVNIRGEYVEIEELYEEGRIAFYGGRAIDCLREPFFNGYAASGASQIRLAGYLDALRDNLFRAEKSDAEENQV